MLSELLLCDWVVNERLRGGMAGWSVPCPGVVSTGATFLGAWRKRLSERSSASFSSFIAKRKSDRPIGCLPSQDLYPGLQPSHLLKETGSRPPHLNCATSGNLCWLLYTFKTWVRNTRERASTSIACFQQYELQHGERQLKPQRTTVPCHRSPEGGISAVG